MLNKYFLNEWLNSTIVKHSANHTKPVNCQHCDLRSGPTAQFFDRSSHAGVQKSLSGQELHALGTSGSSSSSEPLMEVPGTTKQKVRRDKAPRLCSERQRKGLQVCSPGRHPSGSRSALGMASKAWREWPAQLRRGIPRKQTDC